MMLPLSADDEERLNEISRRYPRLAHETAQAL